MLPEAFDNFFLASAGIGATLVGFIFVAVSIAPEQFEEEPEAVTVTRYGKPVMAILPYNTYKSLLETVDSLLETIEILQDEELMTAFRESVRALQNGEMVDWADAKRQLGLA